MRRKQSRRKQAAAAVRPSFARTEPLERRVLFAAQMVISEFMAKNKATLKDDQNLFSDWIELHNAGDALQDLSGWHLTDSAGNLTEWTFPSGASLAPGGYMVVWASGLDHEVVGQPFHTNFKLDDGGEYLALVKPDGTQNDIVEDFAPTFPVQSSDVSYGLSNDNDINSARVYFGTPTPGAHNVANVAPVTFTKPGGAYTAGFALALSTATPNAAIHYTLDGSVPTLASPTFNPALPPAAQPQIAGDTMVRARAFDPNGVLIASTITSQEYFILNASTSAFHSNLPLVVLDTHGASIGQNSQTATSAMVINTPGIGDTTLTQTPQFVGRAGLNVRGQTSVGFPKQQFHFELWDETNNDEKHPLLGMPTESDWILYAPYSEKSLMQNNLAYKWSNEIGEYAVRTQWVEVFLNTSGQATVDYNRDYWGVYLLEEKIKIGPNRVNISKIGAGDDTEPNVTGGYIWHKDKTDPGDTSSFSTVTGQTFLFEDPDAQDLDATQKAWLTNYVNQFETALYGGNFADPVNGYAKYINVQSFVDNWIMVEMAKNIDGFRLSTYYYKDKNGLINMGPIWDYNLSMGNANYNGGDSPTGWYHDNISSFDYTYFDRLTQDPNFMAAIAARWKDLRQSVFSTSSLMGDIDANYTLLTAGNGNFPVGPHPTQTPDNPAVRNFEKWDILGAGVWPNSYVGNSWLDEVNHLKDFISTRVAWMDGQLFPLVPTDPPGTPSALSASALSGVQINLSWTLADANATTLHLEESTDGGTTWSLLADLGGSATSYVVGGLSSGATYKFRLSAANVLGTSGLSNVATATTSFQVPNLNFPNFTGSTSQLTYNGSANINGVTAQITPNQGNQVGSIWTTDRLDIRKFTTTFSFQFNSATADGMTFTIQRVSNTVLGAAGGALGYQGITDSMAIKFDIYPDRSTTGLYTGGAAPGEDGNAIDVNASGVNFHAGHVYSCTLTYDGASVFQTLTDTSTGGTFTHTYTDVNLQSLIASHTTAWVGFTGSTGGATADMRVLSWSYSVIPTDPPSAPSALIATAVSGNKVNLSWNDNSTTEDDFKIYRRTGPAGSFVLAGTVAAGVKTYSDTGLLPNTDYYYYVVANNLAGDSAPTTTKLAHTPIPPKVSQVLVAGSSWSSGFLAALTNAGFGGGGYALPYGSLQLADLPWTNINQIKVKFDQNVTVAQGDLHLYGVNTGSYSFSNFSYDAASFTATWTLAAPLTEDKLLIDLSDNVQNNNGALDGEYTDVTGVLPSGDGVGGGHFMFRFNILPGDVNQDGSVLGNDVILVRNAQFNAPGNAAYSPYYDVNGSATLLGDDVILVRNQQFHSLPGGTPSVPPPAEAVLASVPFNSTTAIVPADAPTAAAVDSTPAAVAADSAPALAVEVTAPAAPVLAPAPAESALAPAAVAASEPVAPSAPAAATASPAITASMASIASANVALGHAPKSSNGTSAPSGSSSASANAAMASALVFPKAFVGPISLTNSVFAAPLIGLFDLPSRKKH